MNHFSDLSPKVNEKALIALDVFLEGMNSEDIEQYLPIVIPKITQVVINTNSTNLMRTAAMSAIGCSATAATLKF